MRRVGLVFLYTMVILTSQLLFGRTPQGGAPIQAGAPQAGPSVRDMQRDLDARVQAMMFEYDCTTPGTWHQDHPSKWDFPKTMVLKQDGTWDLRLESWTIPAPAHAWTMLLCADDPPG